MFWQIEATLFYASGMAVVCWGGVGVRAHTDDNHNKTPYQTWGHMRVFPQSHLESVGTSYHTPRKSFPLCMQVYHEINTQALHTDCRAGKLASDMLGRKF